MMILLPFARIDKTTTEGIKKSLPGILPYFIEGGGI